MPPQPVMAAIHPTHPSQPFSRPSGDVSSFNASFQPQPNPYGQASRASQESMQYANPSFGGSFSEVHSRQPATSNSDSTIYTASYSGVSVYEMEVNGVAAMRRRSDSWLNATQILKIAGIDKGRRTKILEKEILTGQHEKIQGGYGRYQGTWISYRRGREFCRQYGVEDLLRPLLDYDISSDGTGNTAFIDTPTKEQAMAANRKKYFSSTIDNRMSGQISRNTFFQNISPTASTALAAMNKAARYESPLSRPGSAQKRPTALLRQQSSQQQGLSQDSAYVGGSQQSMHSLISDHQTGLDGPIDSIGRNRHFDSRQPGSQEPPRKKIRTSLGQDPYLDPSLEEETPTEPNASFSQQDPQQYTRESNESQIALPMLPTPEDPVTEERRRILLSMLSDQNRTDFSSHPVMNLAGHDLDIPLDGSGNTILHWAGLLGKIFIVRAIVSKGANIFRGNAGGETPLMHAVSVNNTYESQCFSEMLEHLGPLIEVRDAIGRTVLHHIAVASAIKGRIQSSKYYLESLLEYTVKQGSSSQHNSFMGKPQANANLKRPMTLARFMSDVVNIQDRCGNTALNVVARIGSHVIINQLEEVGADFSISNHKGFRPESFGIFPKNYTGSSQKQGHFGSQGLTQLSTGENKSTSHIDQIREEIFATTQTILAQTQNNYTSDLTRLSSLLDTQSTELRDCANEHMGLTTALTTLKAEAVTQGQRVQRINNLHRVKEALMKKKPVPVNAVSKEEFTDHLLDLEAGFEAPKDFPSAERLSLLLDVHKLNNSRLTAKLQQLRSFALTNSDELEIMYRKVISLCTGVKEVDVESLLPQLLGAIEGDADDEIICGEDVRQPVAMDYIDR